MGIGGRRSSTSDASGGQERSSNNNSGKGQKKNTDSTSSSTSSKETGKGKPASAKKKKSAPTAAAAVTASGKSGAKSNGGTAHLGLSKRRHIVGARQGTKKDFDAVITAMYDVCVCVCCVPFQCSCRGKWLEQQPTFRPSPSLPQLPTHLASTAADAMQSVALVSWLTSSPICRQSESARVCVLRVARTCLSLVCLSLSLSLSRN